MSQIILPENSKHFNFNIRNCHNQIIQCNCLPKTIKSCQVWIQVISISIMYFNWFNHQNQLRVVPALMNDLIHPSILFTSLLWASDSLETQECIELQSVPWIQLHLWGLLGQGTQKAKSNTTWHQSTCCKQQETRWYLCLLLLYFNKKKGLFTSWG